jgi:uncharacterized lipoprotein YddW (UPF0748 family)
MIRFWTSVLVGAGVGIAISEWLSGQPKGLEAPWDMAPAQASGVEVRDRTSLEAPTLPPLPGAEEALPARPGRRPSTLAPQPAPEPARGPLPRPAQALPPEISPADPADEVAPAVIELSPGSRSLNPVVALAMQQELKNLIGRFESALLLSNSLDMSTTLALNTPSPILTAAAEPVDLSDGTGRFLHPMLESAQQLLDDWDSLLTQGHHGEIKERWLAVRTALWENFPTERPYAQAEIRAVWLDRGTIVQARSPEGLAQIFDRLATAGITTVFFETVNAGYPIYPSQVAPEQNPLTRRWDPLASAVDLAHERGMTLHAWVWVFAAGNQRHNRLLNLPAEYPGPILARHPTWAGYDNAGNLIPPGQDKPFLDPANPEVRSYLTRLMAEIVRDYAVDGVHLDYIRYPFQDPGANRSYGYGEVARWRFQSISGVDPITLSPRPDPTLTAHQQIQQQVLWNRWTEFRIQQVNSFVETLTTTLRRQRPDLVLSAAVFAHPEHDRLQKIQQDWGTWAKAGYLNWVVLMSYAQDTSRFERLVRPWLVDQTFGSALVIPGIRLLSLSNVAAMDQMQTARDLPTAGYALFATADLNGELSTLLGQTQRSPQASRQTSLQMAFDRYQALQREWHWLLSQQKLWMERDTLNQWIAAANQLEADFEALATAPSRRGLDQVKTGLTQVQAPLNSGSHLLIETTNSAYRLQVWQYRLRVIEQLLHQESIGR